MKNKLIVKLSLLTVAGTILTTTIAPSINAFAYENNINQEKSNFNEFEKYKEYIKVIDNKYVLDPSVENSNSLDLEKLKRQLEFTNSIIDKYQVKDVSLENGFSIYVSDSQISNQLRAEGINAPLALQRAGVTKVQFYWWGFYLYLSSYWTSLAMTAGVGGIMGGIGALLGGGVGAGVAVGVAGAVADFVVSNSERAQRGCVVSYNYAFGVQDVWNQ